MALLQIWSAQTACVATQIVGGYTLQHSAGVPSTQLPWSSLRTPSGKGGSGVSLPLVSASRAPPVDVSSSVTSERTSSRECRAFSVRADFRLHSPVDFLLTAVSCNLYEFNGEYFRNISFPIEQLIVFEEFVQLTIQSCAKMQFLWLRCEITVLLKEL